MPRGIRCASHTCPAAALALACGVSWASVALVSAEARAQTPPAPPVNAPGDYDALDRFQTVLRTLREGVLAENDGKQHATLVALRQLRDPALAPLFTRLLHSEDWSLRVDGLLGLAELSDAGKADLALLEQLPGESDREAGINAVLALRLADSAQVQSMLSWIDLASSQRVLLAGELRRLGGTPELSLLTRLANSKTPEVAGLAVGILLDLKAAEASALMANVRAQIAGLPVATRSAVVAQVAEACTAQNLTGAGGFLASLLTLPDLADDARLRGLGSLLMLSPSDAYPVLAAAVEADRSTAALMRHASVLLASGARADATEWARFRSVDPLLDSIADAGGAIAAGDEAGAFEKLVALERRVVLRAALDGARRLGPSADRAFGLACLRFVLKPGPTPPALSETLLLALFRLAELEPAEFRAALATDDLDEPTKDALLLALLNAGTPAAAEVARTAQGHCSRTGEGQIAVLIARNEASIPPAVQEELMRVAGGGVQVVFPIRVQAAWLWMRHTGHLNDAIQSLAPEAVPTGTARQGETKKSVEKSVEKKQ